MRSVLFVEALPLSSSKLKCIQDNCSLLIFQELLALEERIGNVSTGLTENDVMKLLKQRKFSSWRLSSMEYEPCCICQVSVFCTLYVSKLLYSLYV